MKYFGQYLVSKGIISVEVLVDSLIDQVSSLPSVIELVRKKNLLKPEVLLDLFILQTENKIEFKAACQKMNVWTPEIEKAVQIEMEQIRMPLGHFLVQRGAVDLHSITNALDEFLSTKEKGEVPSYPNDAAKPLGQTEGVISSRPSNTKIEATLVDEFCSYFNESRIEKLILMFSMLRSNETDADKSVSLLKSLLIEFRSLKGLVKFIRFERTEPLISKFEGMLYEAIEQVACRDFHLIPALAESGQSAVHLIKKLKNTLIQEQNGQTSLMSSDIEEQVTDLVKKLNSNNASEKPTAQ